MPFAVGHDVPRRLCFAALPLGAPWDRVNSACPISRMGERNNMNYDVVSGALTTQQYEL